MPGGRQAETFLHENKKNGNEKLKNSFFKNKLESSWMFLYFIEKKFNTS